MRLGIVTLFPQMFEALSEFGISGRAIKNQLLSLNFWNPRDFTEDKHRTVDARPYGGGPGMVMMVEPLTRALVAARLELEKVSGEAVKTSKVVYLSPQGRPLNQSMVKDFAQQDNLILIAGRYEGIDERFIEAEVDEEVSIGDYVLSGGELPAMVLIDAVVRQLPGALGHDESAQQDSFSEGLLDCPHYARPQICSDQPVPAVLLSGNHERIRRWRLQQSLGRTWQRRPELLAQLELSAEQRSLLEAFQHSEDKL